MGHLRYKWAEKLGPAWFYPVVPYRSCFGGLAQVKPRYPGPMPIYHLLWIIANHCEVFPHGQSHLGPHNYVA